MQLKPSVPATGGVRSPYGAIGSDICVARACVHKCHCDTQMTHIPSPEPLLFVVSKFAKAEKKQKPDFLLWPKTARLGPLFLTQNSPPKKNVYVPFLAYQEDESHFFWGPKMGCFGWVPKS